MAEALRSLDEAAAGNVLFAGGALYIMALLPVEDRADAV